MNRINKQMVDSTLTEKEVEKIAEETAKALGSKFSVTKSTIDNGSFDLDYDGVKYDGGSYLVMVNGDIVNVAISEKPIVYNYKTKKKFEFGGDFQSGVYAKGGSLDAHGIHIGDTFLKTLSGTIQKVRDKNGKIVYINLANGERSSTIPLPFDDGGEVKYFLNKDGIKVRSVAKPEKKLTEAEWMAKHNESKEARGYESGGLFGFGGMFNKVVNKPKVVDLDDKQVRLKSGEYVQVLDQDGSSLMVMEVSKLGTGATPKMVTIADVDMTSFAGGGEIEDKLERRLKFINQDAERIYKNAPKGFLDYPVKDWESIGTLLSNIEIASNLNDDESDSWSSIKFKGLNSKQKLERRLKFINEDAERIFKNSPKRFLEHPVKHWESIGTLLSNIEIASNLNDDESDSWSFATGGGVGLIGNQKRIDMNHNGRIDAEDFKLLRSSMNGAWRNEIKHVNHNQDYEVRYAKKKPARTGYKGKRNFKDGGGISNFERLSRVVAKNYEGKKVKPKYQKEYGKVYSKSEAKEVGNKVAGKVKAMKKMTTGGEAKKETRGGVMVLAKKIRKEGESWKDALKRAGQQLK